jgi:hypothetical protein
MDLSSTVSRLLELPTLKGNVAGAAGYVAAAQGGLRGTPAVFVFPLAESAQASPFATEVVQQEVTLRIGVVLAVQNKRDAIGGAAHESMDTLRDTIRGHLLGWAPDAASAPYEFGGGALLELDDQVLFWQDEYVTQTTIRSI